MITLSLLHPIKQSPVQVWTFPDETTIRIGRSTDNQVILYSAVVSRHHVELRRVGSDWEVVNLGTNGTYLDGKRITQMQVTDGAIIRLARSGPNIQIRFGEDALQSVAKVNEDPTFSQAANPPLVNTDITGRHLDELEDAIEPDMKASSEVPRVATTIPVPSHLRLPEHDSHDASSPESSNLPPPDYLPDQSERSPLTPEPSNATTAFGCQHERGGTLFCMDCGHPLQVLQTVNQFNLVSCLGHSEVSSTYRGWKRGQHVVVKTLNSELAANPKAWAALELEADLLRSLNHPGIPQLHDFFFWLDQPYLVMEWMPGISLSERIGLQGTLPASESVAILLELGLILKYLHQFSPPILHHNLHPNHLIYRSYAPANRVSLIGFGAVKHLAMELPLAHREFIAPEAALDTAPADELYALGSLLIYLTTAKLPTRTEGNRPAPSGLTSIPDALHSIVHRLMSPVRSDRYTSAAELISDLKAYQTYSATN